MTSGADYDARHADLGPHNDVTTFPEPHDLDRGDDSRIRPMVELLVAERTNPQRAREVVVLMLAAADKVARPEMEIPIEPGPARMAEAFHAAIERVADLEALADEVLGTFEVKATVGHAVVRSTWQNAERVEAWRRHAHP